MSKYRKFIILFEIPNSINRQLEIFKIIINIFLFNSSHKGFIFNNNGLKIFFYLMKN